MKEYFDFFQSIEIQNTLKLFPNLIEKFKFTAYFCFVNVSHVTNAAAVLTLNDGLVW